MNTDTTRDPALLEAPPAEADAIETAAASGPPSRREPTGDGPDRRDPFVEWPLPERPAASGPLRPPTFRQRAAEAVDAVSASLPMLLMGLVALGTWWLVQNTPLLEAARPPVPPRHEPDSTMNRFMVQRFAPDGTLRIEIEGEQMRHYPDDDTYEIDAARLRSIGSDGLVTQARARRALSNRDASEVRLSDGARVVREASATEAAIDFRGERLDLAQATEQVRSDRPVVVTQGETVLHADGMAYDHLARVLTLHGKVRAVLAAGTVGLGRKTTPKLPAAHAAASATRDGSTNR